MYVVLATEVVDGNATPNGTTPTIQELSTTNPERNERNNT